MRQRFESQPAFHLVPIERIVLPVGSRDELPPILAGLQWIWCHPALREDIFQLLERAVLTGKKATGRPGMELWQILVLGVVRLGLDADWDRMEYLANYDLLLRQMLGVSSDPWAKSPQLFNHQTLRDNVALLDEAVLQEINARVAAAGREVFHPKSGPAPALAIKVDTYVLETDVHFPTDLNLLFDAGRKCLDLIEKYREQFDYRLEGWRKLEDWRRRFKAAERVASKVVFGGGKEKEKRVRAAIGDYLEIGHELCAKVIASLLSLCDQPVEEGHWETLAYFEQMLSKHLDLVDRRLLRGQTIPAAEKIYSLFEPHTEWINKGKLHPSVELGHRLLIATDQDQLIQDYDVPVGGADVNQSILVVSRLLERYGDEAIQSISFDKGFTRQEDRELLKLYIPEVVMPKRGKKNAEETEREKSKRFVALRRRHSAVESQINALEHHGLDRCLDIGLEGYRRYVGYGVLAYNLHQIGRHLLERDRVKVHPVPLAA